jgi:hypothetical protein
MLAASTDPPFSSQANERRSVPKEKAPTGRKRLGGAYCDRLGRVRRAAQGSASGKPIRSTPWSPVEGVPARVSSQPSSHLSLKEKRAQGAKKRMVKPFSGLRRRRSPVADPVSMRNRGAEVAAASLCPGRIGHTKGSNRLVTALPSTRRAASSDRPVPTRAVGCSPPDPALRLGRGLWLRALAPGRLEPLRPAPGPR